MNVDDLIALARKARARAHAPYSKYKVGAALLGRDGRVFLGCNVENASYGLTVCAERNAYFQAVAAGCTQFTDLAVVTRDGASLCGACRQVAREFGTELAIHLARPTGRAHGTTLAKLLPDSFGPRFTRWRSPSKTR